MRKPWEQRLHGLVIALHPRAFRDEFGEEMRIVMKDLLEDPDVTRRRVWLAMLGDLGNAMNGGVKLGVISGVVILAICVANRAVDLGAADPSPNISFAVIALILIAAAYSGTRRGGLLRGIGVGVVAGAVSSLSFAADYLFGFRWFSDPMFVGVLIMVDRRRHEPRPARRADGPASAPAEPLRKGVSRLQVGARGGTGLNLQG
jgi:hypothetical protein